MRMWNKSFLTLWLCVLVEDLENCFCWLFEKANYGKDFIYFLKVILKVLKCYCLENLADMHIHVLIMITTGTVTLTVDTRLTAFMRGSVTCESASVQFGMMGGMDLTTFGSNNIFSFPIFTTTFFLSSTSCVVTPLAWKNLLLTLCYGGIFSKIFFNILLL